MSEEQKDTKRPEEGEAIEPVNRRVLPPPGQIPPGSPYGQVYYEEWKEPETIHLIDYANILLKRRWLIVLGVFFSVLFVGIKSKTTDPTFTASAKFLPSKSPDMISRMGTLVGGGEIKSFEDNVTSEYYVELLKSSAFLERITARKFASQKAGGEVDLAAYYKVVGENEAIKNIKTNTAISKTMKTSVDRLTKVISLSYSTGEAGLSAAIVNAFLDELILYNQTIRDSKSKQNREFIETQLKENKGLLDAAEKALSDFTSKNKKIQTPEVQLESDRLQRAVKVQEEVYITLKKQLELAKIEEQEKRPSIEILQRAVPPLTRSAPSTRKNVMLAGFVSLILFCGLAFVLEYASKLSSEEKRNQEFLGYLGDIKNDFLKVGKFVGIIRKKKSSTRPK
jgi:uncharacterized protein involved in exopolysaccharide biosynthesis